MSEGNGNGGLEKVYRKFKVLGLLVERITCPEDGEITDEERVGVLDLVSEIDGLLKAQTR